MYVPAWDTLLRGVRGSFKLKQPTQARRLLLLPTTASVAKVTGNESNLAWSNHKTLRLSLDVLTLFLSVYPFRHSDKLIL